MQSQVLFRKFYLLSAIFMLLALTGGLAQGEMVSYQVSAGADDGFAQSATVQDTTAGHLKIGDERTYALPYQMSGMRFTNINIPRSATITSAYLKITSINTDYRGQIYGAIAAEASDNPADFSSRMIGNAALTTATVAWDFKDAWSPDTQYISPDISNVIQEVVSRSGFSSTNSIAIYYSTRDLSGKARSFASYEYNPVSAAILEVTYETYTISGHILTTEATGLAGVTVSAGADIESDVTDATGYYELKVPLGWSGTAIVNKSGWDITPLSRVYSNITSDLSTEDYIAYQPKISGYVKDGGGTGIEGVLVSADNGGGSGTTDATGYYEIVVPYDWSGRITPNNPPLGWGFLPIDRSYYRLTFNVPDQNFTTFQPYISGYVVDGSSERVPGVAVSADNGGGSDTTDANGYYRITVPYNWSGTISVIKAGWDITPTTRAYNNVIRNLPSQNYIAYQLTICEDPYDVAWMRQLGTSASDFSYSVAVDSSGNAFISGITDGNLGGTNAGGYDAFLAKYDPAGNLLWTKQLGTSANDSYGAVAVDGFGNAFISGWTRGSLGGINMGSDDAFLAKYDTAGNLLWIKQIGTGAWDLSFSVAVDASGNAFISGYTTGNLGGTNAGNSDAFLAKYDPNGNLFWIKQFGTSADDSSYSVAVDASGNAFISGLTSGSLGGTNVGSEDVFLAKFDPNGNLLWTEQIGTIAPERSRSVVVDGAGNVFISGLTYGSLGGTNVGEIDAFLAKYDTNGNLLWIEQLGTSRDEYSFSVAVDTTGNAFISGYTYGILGGTNAGGSDAFISKYDPSGNLLWTHQLGTSGGDVSRAMALDGFGNAFISGYTTGNLGGTNAGQTDAFLVKFIAPSEILEAAPTLDAAADFSYGGAILTDGGSTITMQNIDWADIDHRGILEFDIGSIPDEATITSATLELDIAVKSGSGDDQPILYLHGYQGNGTAEIADGQVPLNLIGQSDPILALGMITIDLDVDYIGSLLSVTDYLGLLTLGDENGKQAGFVTLEGEIPDIRFAPKLTINYIQYGLTADMAPYGGDGSVNFLDWAVFANAWQSTGEPPSANWNPECDIAPAEGNGVVDMNDLAVFVSQWLQCACD